MSHESLFETVEATYGAMEVFRCDVGAVSQALRLYGEWAGNELSFMRQFLHPGSTVLDVGAYIGTHAVAFSHFVGPEGRVIAFEGQPETFALLERNVRVGALGNVELHQALVSNGPGVMEIAAIASNVDGSFGSASARAQDAGAGMVRVNCVTVDSLGLEACSLVKIDAEGMEAEVLQGALETLSRLRPIVYAECNDVEDGARTLAVLRAAGYTSYLHVVDAFNRDNARGESNNIFGPAREVAFVAAPEDEEARLRAIQARPCELILKIETLDDLVLGLLNKPQYPGEILEPGAAARTGGMAWLQQFHAARQALKEKPILEQRNRVAEWGKREMAQLHAELEKSRADAAAAEREAAEASARAEAAIRQADLIGVRPRKN